MGQSDARCRIEFLMSLVNTAPNPKEIITTSSRHLLQSSINSRPYTTSKPPRPTLLTRLLNLHYIYFFHGRVSTKPLAKEQVLDSNTDWP